MIRLSLFGELTLELAVVMMILKQKKKTMLPNMKMTLVNHTLKQRLNVTSTAELLEDQRRQKKKKKMMILMLSLNQKRLEQVMSSWQ